ncbi:MAG: polyketide synthase dehydratase domain-containing protein, partial [Nocardiopsaceae bacterium]|nr:polyketide synthase dehydratase domain-containing protein [Nocardiopsaceae bacterium]
GSALAALRAYADRSPEAAELAALLEETANAALDVLGAMGSRTVLRVGLDTMPYLADHAFHLQPDGWPEPADTMPVVPATAIIEHMITEATTAAPGTVGTEVENLQLRQWTLAVPPQDVEVVAEPATQKAPDGQGKAGDPDQWTVSFGPYARATVRTAPTFPPDPPEAWSHDPATERPPAHTVEQLYGERLAFHGLRYQSVAVVHAESDRHIRATVRGLPSPGATLDSGMQLIGNWVLNTQPTRTLCLPATIGSVRLYRRIPTDGERIGCAVRITSLTDRQVTADVQFTDYDGVVWAEIRDATSRRFDRHPRAFKVERTPGRAACALRQPEGWVAMPDYWPDPASQDYIVRLMAGERGYREFERKLIAHRKPWLLGQVAVKDAVRLAAWDEDGTREIFPVQVDVTADADGRAVAVGPLDGPPGDPGGSAPERRAAFAYADGVAVAITAPPAGQPSGTRTHGIGIGLAGIGGKRKADLSAEEEALLAAVSGEGNPGEGASGEGSRSSWLARFLAARDAAAQASAPGPGRAEEPETGQPPGDSGPPRVTGADESVITVEAGGHSYRMHHRELGPPEDPAARRLAVAWT